MTQQSVTLVLSAVGTAVALFSLIQGQRDRRRQRAKESRADLTNAIYDRIISAYEMKLAPGDPGQLVEILPGHMPLILRAVRERRLVLSGFTNMVALPGDTFDA